MVTASDCLNDIWFRGNFLSLADMDQVDSYCTTDSALTFMQEALELLAYRSGAFVTSETLGVTAGIARYVLAPENLFTLAVFLDGKNLRISPWRELSALDSHWSTTNGTPTRASFDADAPGVIVLYPRPIASGTLTLIAAHMPPAITAGSSTVQVPEPFESLFSYNALAQSRLKESEGRQEEMGQHYSSRVDLMIQIAAFLYGPGA